MRNSSAQDKINSLEQKLDESERKHAKEVNEIKQTNMNLASELKQKKQELVNEALKADGLSSEYARLKVEVSRLESFRQKSEALEKELVEVKAAKAQRSNDYDLMMMTTNRRAYESGEKFESEIKLLNSQVSSLVSFEPHTKKLLLFIFKDDFNG